MSLFYNNNAGVLLPVSGLNGQSGELVVGVSAMKSGSKTSDTSSWASQESGTFSIDFDTPMPDADYIVEVTIDKIGVSHEVTNKTANGFKCQVMNIQNNTIPSKIIMSYKAFKLYTASDVTTLQNDVTTLQNKVNGSVTCTLVPPFCVTKNNFSVTVSTLDGMQITDVPLTAYTWETNVRNLGVISSNVSSPAFVMVPCSYQSGDRWIAGCGRVYYSGRIDLWCSESLSAYVPYFNCTLPIP